MIFFVNMVRVTGLEPALTGELDPKSSASANFAIPAIKINKTGDPQAT